MTVIILTDTRQFVSVKKIIMKILIATDFYIHNLGGVTTSILALCAGLRKLGHEVKVLALSDRYESYRDHDDYFIRSFPVYYAPGMRMTLSFNDPLIEELIEWGPDIIHVQSESSANHIANKIQKKLNIPLIITCHTDYAYFVFGKNKEQAFNRKVAEYPGWFVYHSAFRIIVPAKKALHFSFLKQFSDRMIVLPNGIELEKYQLTLSPAQRQEMLKELGIDDNRKLLVSITRLSREKNIQEIISYLPALVEKVPEATMLIAGDGPYEKELRTLVSELKLEDHVIFAGRIASQDVWRYYALSDVFVSASLFELHSMSYLEALAQGLPLLCRADEALDGVLKHGYNGYIYNTAEEFTEYASRILTDDKLHNEMSSASLETVKHFSSDVFGQSAAKIYENVIAEWQKHLEEHQESKQ